MATMLEVAKRAGVSVSTVSHVLNGTRKVSAETARLVGEAVSAVGYIPNTLARALARSTTSTIGVAVSAISNLYFGKFAINPASAFNRYNFRFVSFTVKSRKFLNTSPISPVGLNCRTNAPFLSNSTIR